MKVETFFTPDSAKDDALRGRTVAVIDILRATTTMVTAMANGCREILPQASMDQAVQLKGRLGRSGVLLGGERGGKKIPGFDLGNSPLEYTPEVVKGKSIIFTTTNGTRALVRTKVGVSGCVVSLLNVTAAANLMARAGRNAAVLCAGREGRFSQEDSVCAGLLIQRMAQALAPEPLNLDDASRAAVLLAEKHGAELVNMLKNTDHGWYLTAIGFTADLEYCGQLDKYQVVPEYKDGRVA
jgi:2-phosphosulfolactate phosphatase